MRTNLMKGLHILVLLFCSITITGCWSSHAEESDIIITEHKFTPSPNPSITFLSETIQISSTKVPTTTPIPKESTIPYPISKPSAAPPTELEVMNDVVDPFSEWILYKGVPEGQGFPDVIYITRNDGIGQRRILDNEHSQGWEHPEALSWSPNGQWISFIASPIPSISRSEIYIARPDGSNLQRLTNTPGIKTAESWSPDGKSVIYSQTTEKFNHTEVDLYMVEVASGMIRQISNTPNIYEHSPAYAPTGNTIAYTLTRPDEHPVAFNLMLMDVDGKNNRQLLDSSLNVLGFAWSPNGEQIALSLASGSNANCDEGLYVIDVDGRNIQQLTNRSGSVRFPAWSSDGKWIAFDYSEKCDGSALWQINLIDISDGELTTVASSSLIMHNPVWSPLPALAVGNTFFITESGSQLKLRSAPTLSGDILEKLIEGEKIFVMKGPFEGENFLWWLVRVGDNDREGWIAENPGWFTRDLPLFP